MASVRASILSAIDTRLKGILIAGGYNSNLGQNVFEWKTTPFGSDEIPGINYLDPSNVHEIDGPVGKFRWLLTVDVEIIAQASAATMRGMIRDVLKAVGIDPTWGKLAQRTGQPGVEIQVDQEDKTITGAKIVLPITYDSPLWED